MQILSLSALLAAPLSAITGLMLTVVFVAQVLIIVVLDHKRIKLLEFANSYKYTLSGLALFLLWATASLAWSLNFTYSLKDLLAVSSLLMSGTFFLIYITVTVKAQNLSRYIKIGFIAALLVFSAEAFADYLVSRNLRSLIGSDADEFRLMANLNRGACFLSIFFWPIVYAIYQVCHAQKTKAVFIFISWLLVLTLLTQMSSISALLAFIISSVVFVLLIASKARLLKLLLAGMFLAIVAFPFTVRFAKFNMQESASIDMPDSALHRIYIWNFTLDKIAEKPLFGWGYGSSRFVPGAEEAISVKGEEGQRINGLAQLPNHPHNFILQVLLELGFIGFVIMLAIFALISIKIYRAEVSIVAKASLTSLFFAYITIDMFAFSVWSGWWISSGFIVLGLLLGSAQKN